MAANVILRVQQSLHSWTTVLLMLHVLRGSKITCASLKLTARLFASLGPKWKLASQMQHPFSLDLSEKRRASDKTKGVGSERTATLTRAL